MVDASQTVLVYTAGSVAGTATSMPSGLGVTEAAMVAAYRRLGWDLKLALSAVLVFRALSFWLPIPLGLAAGWYLRRAGKL